jgi:gluconolactonase
MKFIFAAFVFSLWGFVFADDHIFADGSDWEVVSSGHQFAEGMAWDEDGHFYFTDVPRLQLFKVDKDSGIKTLVDAQSGRTNGIAFGSDGKLYGCSSKDEGINVWNPNTWEKETLAKGTPSNDIAILDDGTIFFTDPNNKSVWRIDANSRERTLAASLAWKPNGIGLSLDERTLLVAEFDSGTVHGYAINRGSRLSGHNRPAYKVAMPSDGLGRLDGMQVLGDGRLLIGTALGLQVAPPVGEETSERSLIVVPSPGGRPRCNYARISPDNEWIYTAHRDDLLRRRLKTGFGL